jgi:hypothetical protein
MRAARRSAGSRNAWRSRASRSASSYDSRPQAFSPTRWEWISDKFARYFDCDPEDVSEAETEAGDFITVKGEIVGFVRTRIG